MSQDSAPPWSARLATAAIFFVNGAGTGGWVVRIPEVQQHLGLSTGTLGLMLLGVPLGALVSMPLAGVLVNRHGSKPVSLISAFAFLAVLPLPVLAPAPGWLGLALVLMGATSGALDLAMNAQAVTVEARFSRPIMSSFHALFSLGGLAGSGVGGLLAHAGVSPPVHLSGAAVTLAGVALVSLPRFLPPTFETLGTGGPAFALPSRSLLVLGVMAFCVLMGEGAMADWTAVYLRQVMHADPGLAAAGYSAFSLAMAAGRLAGDSLAIRLGQVGLVRVGGLVAALGLGSALVLGGVGLSITGFGLVGAGLSIIFPNLVSAAAKVKDQAPGTAIAAISTVGYTGFMAGPPIIGFAAEFLTLRGALGLVVLSGLIIATLAGVIRRP